MATNEFEKLIERLRRVEALHDRTDVEGEKNAAAEALKRIREKMAQFEQADPPIEYRFSMSDAWSKRVFIALLRRYGLTPYRYHGQRRTTVMVRVSKAFVDETLWPEYKQISDLLEDYLSDITDRVIQETIHEDSSDVTEIEKPRRIGH